MDGFDLKLSIVTMDILVVVVTTTKRCKKTSAEYVGG